MLSRIARNAAATFAHQRQAISSSPALRGLEEFFEAPLKEGQERTAGENHWTLANCAVQPCATPAGNPPAKS